MKLGIKALSVMLAVAMIMANVTIKAEGVQTEAKPNELANAQDMANVRVQGEEFTVDDINYTVIDNTNECYVSGNNSVGGEITIPAEVMHPTSGTKYTVKYIGDRAFISTDLSSITLSNGLESIGAYAFSECLILERITLPDSLKDIGTEAFMECTSLKSIEIPNSVTIIGMNAFGACISLEAINVDINNKNYSSEDGVMFNKDKTILVQYPIGKKVTSYEIPNGVTSIGNSAFSDCTGLEMLTFPDSLESIGDSAFINCTSLKDITFPDSLESIGDSAFVACTSLKGIIFPDSLKSIGTEAFSGCTGLEMLTFPDSLESIGNSAFYGCTNLDFITLSDNLKSIGNEVFRDCTRLSDIDIPNSVTSIGNSTFNGCTSLKSITFPDSLNGIGTEAFRDCVSLKGGYNERLTFPDSLESIGNSAFYGCKDLASITFPDSLKDIGTEVFSNCTSLASITFPDSLESIGDNAFINCTSLKDITFPDSLESMGDSTFYGCTGLESIKFSNSLKSIGAYAFSECLILERITLPDSLKDIGTEVFSNCTSLASITFPDSLESIGDNAFINCTSLKDITFPDSLESIGDSAFVACTSLKGIIFPDSLKSIGTEAFMECTSLKSIEIPDSVTIIGMNAFGACTSLEAINVGINNKNYSSEDGVIFNKDKTILVQYPIGKKVTSYEIPNGVTSIGDYAFVLCSNLKSITFPDSLKIMGGTAFAMCTNLKYMLFAQNSSPTISTSDVFFGTPLVEENSGAKLYTTSEAKQSFISAGVKEGNIVEVTLPKKPTGEPTGLKAKLKPSATKGIGVELSWDSQAEVDGYQLYRSDAEGEAYYKVGDVVKENKAEDTIENYSEGISYQVAAVNINTIPGTPGGEDPYEGTELVVEGDKSEPVNIELNKYQISSRVEPSEGGSIEELPQKEEELKGIEFKVTANKGYEIKEVYYEYEGQKQVIKPQEGVYKLTMPSSDVTVVAEFEKIPTPGPTPTPTPTPTPSVDPMQVEGTQGGGGSTKTGDTPLVETGLMAAIAIGIAAMLKRKRK